MSPHNDTQSAFSYTTTTLQIPPNVRRVIGEPGRYVVDFLSLALGVSAAQWDEIDAAVRAGMASGAPRVVA